jgi:pimeloyl-ACP methyl ester carboxylesterase
MGAANLLQALPNEPRFCAAVAESPFSSFREVAYDRLGQRVGGGARIGWTVFRPLISEAFLDARVQYGLDLRKASLVNAVASTHVPVLLIHCTQDFNIPLRHCQAILKNRSGVMELWQVPGAGHTGAFGQQPEEFERRVTDWFSRYSRK